MINGLAILNIWWHTDANLTTYKQTKRCKMVIKHASWHQQVKNVFKKTKYDFNTHTACRLKHQIRIKTFIKIISIKDPVKHLQEVLHVVPEKVYSFIFVVPPVFTDLSWGKKQVHSLSSSCPSLTLHLQRWHRSGAGTQRNHKPDAWICSSKGTVFLSRVSKVKDFPDIWSEPRQQRIRTFNSSPRLIIVFSVRPIQNGRQSYSKMTR